jgi:hypothetical protein
MVSESRAAKTALAELRPLIGWLLDGFGGRPVEKVRERRSYGNPGERQLHNKLNIT